MKRIIILFLFFTVFGTFSAYGQTFIMDGDRCFDSGDYTCAITHFEEAFKIASDKDKRNTEILLMRAKRCSESIKAANQAFNNNNYSTAKDEYLRVLDSNPKDEYAKAQLEKCRNILDSQTYLKDGDGCFDKGNYACAETKYSEAITLVSGRDEQFIERKLIQAKNCIEWIKTANQFFANKNYSVAKENYQKVLDANPKDTYVKAQLEKCNNILNPPTTTLSVSTNSLSFSSSGGNQNVTVTTTAESYFVNALPSWCTVQKQAGSFVVTCTANSGSTERTGNFTIAAGDKSIRINVNQSGVKAAQETTLRVTKDVLSFTSSGGNSEDIKVYSNAGNYSVSLLPSWCSVKTFNGYFVISCNANYSGQARSSSFQVNAGDKNIKITVNQAARVTQSSNSLPTSYRKSENCFNCPKTHDSWGLTFGFAPKSINNSIMDCAQLGIKFEPLFKYGFGLNTGLIFEGYSDNIFEGDFYFYAINIPLHLEYRLNFHKWFNMYFYGGIGLNAVTDPHFEEYNFPVTFEYGGGIRFSHIQFSVGRKNYLGDLRYFEDFGHNSPYMNWVFSTSIMF